MLHHIRLQWWHVTYHDASVCMASGSKESLHLNIYIYICIYMVNFRLNHSQFAPRRTFIINICFFGLVYFSQNQMNTYTYTYYDSLDVLIRNDELYIGAH